MRVEVSCHDQTYDYDQILRTMFSCVNSNVDAISLPSIYIKYLSEFKDEIDLSALIDFPYGLSDTEIRIHEMILAIRRGCKFIDLVVNSSYLKNKQWSEIRKDILSCGQACKSSRVNLRLVLEYRLFLPELILELCHFLGKLNIDTIITSTGTIVDDINDNIIISEQIQRETGVNVITCSNFMNKKSFETINLSDIYGIRVTSHHILENF